MEGLRHRIDRIDQQIITLLNQRFELCSLIGREKQAKDRTGPVFVPSREHSVFEKAAKFNSECNGVLTGQAVRSIFREIMSFSISLQRSMTVGYIGEPGSLNHMATRTKFGSSIPSHNGFGTVADVCSAIQRKEVEYAVVSVSDEDQLIDLAQNLTCSETYIYANILMTPVFDVCAISDHLDRDRISAVFVTPEACFYCRSWLADNLTNVQRISVPDISSGFSQICQLENAAIICTPLSSCIFDAHPIIRSVQDLKSVEEFLIIGNEHGPKMGSDETFLLCSSCNRHGTDTFTETANMCSVEISKLSSERGANFIAKVIGHVDDEKSNVKQLVKELRDNGFDIRVCGSTSKRTLPSEFTIDTGCGYTRCELAMSNVSQATKLQ